MPTRWVARTYTYSEPVYDSDPGANDESESNGDAPNAESVTIAIRGATSKPDFDSGYDTGYRAGWVAGYGAARHRYGAVNQDDLAVEGTGESPSFLL